MARILGAMGSNFDWAGLVLVRAGLPLTTVNVDNIARWMTAENPVSDWWNHENPLNINASGFGYDTFPNLDVAAAKTASVICQGNMAGISNALRLSAATADFSAAVCRSPWAESRYGVAAAGAPAKWVVAGRGLNYLATLPDPPHVSGPAFTPVPAPSPPTPLPPVPAPSEDTMPAYTLNDPAIEGGSWIVDTDDGHVESNGGSPFLGAMNEPHPDRDGWKEVGPISGFTAWKDQNGEWGYAIWVKHPAPFGPDGRWFSAYTFARDGSNK